MGTLSYSGGKPFGYEGELGTCHWCGDKLRYQRVTAYDEKDKADPTYKEERSGRATKRASRPGGYQDGVFCGLRCGYQWAVRRLS